MIKFGGGKGGSNYFLAWGNTFYKGGVELKGIIKSRIKSEQKANQFFSFKRILIFLKILFRKNYFCFFRKFFQLISL